MLGLVAQADPVIYFSQNTYNMTPGSDSGSTIQLYVVNDTATNQGPNDSGYGQFGIQGINLYVMIGNGDSETSSPTFDTPLVGTGGDIITGTIFATNNTGAIDGGLSTVHALQIGTNTNPANPLLYVNDVPGSAAVVMGGGIPANGPSGGLLLATLHINTNGVAPGTDWTLDINGLHDILPLDLSNPNMQLTLGNDATIHVVPEPTSVVLGLFAVAGLGRVAIRRRRHAA